MKRREYQIEVTINRMDIRKVVIDPHYEENHSESISDELILNHVKELNGLDFRAEKTDENYSYFAADVLYGDKPYRLIWLFEAGKMYVGVLNAYRKRRKK